MAAPSSVSAAPTASPLFLREHEVRRGVELLFFGYTRLTRAIDDGLAEHGLGRAHHRALYFIARQPDLTISELLKILAITKQSLGRVLTDLAERELVETRTGEVDRRQKLLRLTAAGNVGILSSAPTATLSVGTNGSGTATPLAFLAYNSTALGTALDDMRYISEFGGSAGNNVRLLFALHRTSIADPNWGTTAWRIQPAVDASFTGAGSNRGYVELAFGNQGAYQGIGLSGSGTTTPDFIVNNSGNVGIGTLNPAYKLAINDSGTGLGFTNAASGNFNIGLLAGVADANAYIYQRANAALIIGTNNTERMRITSAGFVGINNSSPTQYLQVNNGALFSQGSSDWFGIRGNSQTIPPADTGSNAVLAINGNFSNGGGEVNFWNTTSIAGGFRFMQRTGSSTYNDMMYMQGNTGRVGINTLSPAAQLNIVDATASGSFSNALIVQKSDANTSAYYNGARINLQNTSATANNYMSIGFGASSGTDVAAIWSSASVHTGGAATGYLAFGTNNAGTAASERMRIAAGGGVSIASSANNGEVFRTSQNAASNPSTSGNMTTGVIFQAGDGGGALNIGNNNVVTWYNSAYANNAGVPLAHAWYTGGTEKMRILSGGDVCVGTTTSTFIYQGSNTTTSAFTISTGGYDCLNLISTAVNPTLDFSALNSTSNVFRFANIQGVMTTNTAGSEAGALTFNTSTGSANSTERMRVSATGDVLINTTDNTLYNNTSGYGVCYRVNASFDVLSTNDICVILNRTGTDGTILEFRKAGTVVGSVSVTGSATAYNTASDYRLKENIAPMMGALDTVAKLKPVTYDWKDGGSSQGFIAHELADVVPDAVTGEKDAVDEEGKAVYQGIDTSFLVATLTAAIQEQQALIEKLTNRLNALEGK